MTTERQRQIPGAAGRTLKNSQYPDLIRADQRPPLTAPDSQQTGSFFCIRGSPQDSARANRAENGLVAQEAAAEMRLMTPAERGTERQQMVLNNATWKK